MKFPVIKKRKFFVWYANHWINVNHEVAIRGGGWKGFQSFISGINNCRKGKHTYHTVFMVESLSSCVRCCYCHKEK